MGGLTVIEKLVMAVVTIVTAPTLTFIVGCFLEIFANYPRLKLTIVMVIWPLICTVGYFWIIDNYLKAEDERQLVPSEDDEYAKKRVSCKTLDGMSGIHHDIMSGKPTFADSEISKFDDWKRKQAC